MADRERAREMRSQGMTVTQIAYDLGVAISTSSVWCKGVEISSEKLSKIRENKIRALRKLKTCTDCGNAFPQKVEVAGKLRSLANRKRCLDCQPFQVKNATMRNGPYLLIDAPPEYPGLRYRDKYCYEHTYVYWKNTGVLPGPNECVHHKNENRHDNRFSNLELKTKSRHTKEHNDRGEIPLVLLKCPTCGEKFVREPKMTHLESGRNIKATYCSRSCTSVVKDKPYLAENIVGMFRFVGTATVAEAEGILKVERT